MHIYIYIYTHTHMCIHIHMCIYVFLIIIIPLRARQGARQKAATRAPPPTRVEALIIGSVVKC